MTLDVFCQQRVTTRGLPTISVTFVGSVRTLARLQDRGSKAVFVNTPQIPMFEAIGTKPAEEKNQLRARQAPSLSTNPTQEQTND
jgi:hypothetical protein